MWRGSLEKVERACEVETGLRHETSEKKKKKNKKKNWSQQKRIVKKCRITPPNK
jgi:hypothetical protein